MSNRMTAGVLTGLFLAMLLVVPITQAVLELTDGERPHIIELFLRPPTVAHLRPFETALEERSWFAQQLRPCMQHVEYTLFGHAGPDALAGQDGWQFYRPGVQYLVEPLTSDRRDEAVSAVVAFRDALAARGIDLLVVPAPGKASVYPDRLTRRAAIGDGTLLTHTAGILDQLREQGIEAVDLLEAFSVARQREDSPSLYLQQDTHWSPTGVRSAADAVAQRLLALGWIEKGPAQFKTRTVDIERHGDVIRMAQVPALERAVSPEKITCEQVVNDSGDVYEDDPASDVLVLGDSFLRIYQQDEPGSAGFIAHLARALGQPLASVVNDGGASTLVRQELYRKPALLARKKVVVWEFVERDIRFGTEGWQDVPLPQSAEFEET